MSIVPDLAQPLRNAILATPAIVAQLPSFRGEPAVFTRRPVDPDAPYPMIVVSANVAQTNQDGISDGRPAITRDIAVYGLNDTAEHYRTTEAIGDLVFDLFHRHPEAITLVAPSPAQGWNVVASTCSGPRSGPTDDDWHVGRIVTVVVLMANPVV